MDVTVTKRIEVDAAHRLPDHSGKCRNLHGHRYVIEATLTGPVEADGMVVDYGIVKEVLVQRVDRVLDHGIMLDERDEELIRLCSIEGWRYKTFPYQPTAEVIAAWCYGEVLDGLRAALPTTHVVLDAVTVWETPTSSATYARQQSAAYIDVVLEALKEHA